MQVQEHKQITFCIAGCCGENNTGDDILLIALVRGIMAKIHNSNIVILTANRNDTTSLLTREGVSFKSIRTVYSGRWGILEPGRTFPLSLFWVAETFLCILQSQLLLIGTGNLVQDDINRFKILFYLSRAILAYLFKTPFGFIAIGVGNVVSKLSRQLFKIMSHKAVFISTRDKTSARQLMEMGIDNSIIIPLSDLSFYEVHEHMSWHNGGK